MLYYIFDIIFFVYNKICLLKGALNNVMTIIRKIPGTQVCVSKLCSPLKGIKVFLINDYFMSA
jgi:hypothetical protein